MYRTKAPSPVLSSSAVRVYRPVLCHGPARQGLSCFLLEERRKHANPRRYRVRGLTLTRLADSPGRGLECVVHPTVLGAVQELATLGATDHRLFPLGSRTHGAETTCAPWQGAADAACYNPQPRSLSCFLLRSPSARVQVPEEPDPEPCLRLAPSEKLQAPCLRHTPPTAVPPSTPCTTTFPLRNRRTTTSRPILTLVRRIIFPRTYALGLRPAQSRTTPRPRRLRTRTSRAESIGLRWLLALASRTTLRRLRSSHASAPKALDRAPIAQSQ